MLNIILLLGVAAARFEGLQQLPAQCAIGFKFSFIFDFGDASGVGSAATSLGWVKPAGDESYVVPAANQVHTDLAATIPGLTKDLIYDFGTKSASGDGGSFLAIDVCICDDQFEAPAIGLAVATEAALLNPLSSLRVRNPLWAALKNDTFLAPPQFQVELVWASAAAADIMVDTNEVEVAVRAALDGAVQPSLLEEVEAELFSVLVFKESVLLHIDDVDFNGGFGNQTRQEYYEALRAAILLPNSTLRTTDPYFKLWVSPTSITSSSVLSQPLWIALVGLLGASCW